MPDAKEKIIQDQEHWLQQQDDELVKLREQCQKLWISNDRHDAEIQALMEVLAKSSRDLEQLQKTNLSQHHELQTCKDNLFRLQPVTQLTDSDILKQYETLCQQVSNWVDNELSKFEDKSGYPVNDTRIITDGGSNSIKRLLNSTPEAGEYLVSAEIHENIQRHFFGENVILFGLSQNITGFLHCVEEHMATLEPRRDTTTINAWRSETLKAIAATPKLIQSKKDGVKAFTDDLFDALQKIFPGLLDEPKSKLRLYQDVSKYAVKLEASIHQSSTEYWFEPFLKPGYVYNPVRDTDLTWATWIDVETRKTLKPDSSVIPDSNGFIGTPLILIEPCLVRYDRSEKKTTTLRPSKWLIKLHKPLPRRTR